MMVHTAYGADRTVKQRSKQALQDEFLQRAVKFTTQRLKNGKQKAAEEHGNWEQWRERGRQIRLHTIAHLDYYLNLFADNARKHGAHVYFAKDAADAASITREIVREKQAKTVVKSKSMVTEELHINQVLAEMDVAAIETDLGEYIIQLAQEPPSHIIIPAIHKNKQQIADLLSEEAGEKLEADTQVLAGFVRRKLREQFLSAEIGITGCNFAIAESGSIVIFENEGNARMVSTLPKTQITYMGMERIIPSFEDLEVMATLLPRSATGQKLTAYMSAITGPKRRGDGDGPEELHIIIIDNGRSRQLGDPDFQELLNCIRCGACLNVCPVYRHIGGHSYGSVYSGPIGAVLTPALQEDPAQWQDIADASSLCGACWEACPVKIPLHDMLVYLRSRKVESGVTPPAEKAAFRGFSYVMSDPRRLSRLLKAGRIGQKLVARGGYIRIKGPLKGWTNYRDLPELPPQSFRDRWPELAQELEREQPAATMIQEIEARLKKVLEERAKGARGNDRWQRCKR